LRRRRKYAEKNSAAAANFFTADFRLAEFFSGGFTAQPNFAAAAAAKFGG
jgi:hypothetical protein